MRIFTVLSVLSASNWRRASQIALLVTISLLSLLAPQPVQAVNDSCFDDWGVQLVSPVPPDTIKAGATLPLNFTGFVTTKTYKVKLQKFGFFGNDGPPLLVGTVTGTRTTSLTLAPPNTNTGGKYDILVEDEAGAFCEAGEFEIESNNNCQLSISQAGFDNTACVDVESGEVTVDASNIVVEGKPANELMIVRDAKSPCGLNATRDVSTSNGEMSPVSYTMEESDIGKTCYLEIITQESLSSLTGPEVLCSANFKLIQACDDSDRTAPLSDTTFNLCEQIPKGTEAFGRCARCVAGQDVDGSGMPASPDVPVGIWTAVGCIKNDPQNIVTVVIKVGMGVAGGVALLMILAASFTLSTSQGDAKKTAEGKEMITSAIIGLIFIIMAVTVLEFIGVKIFRLPGFGE